MERRGLYSLRKWKGVALTVLEIDTQIGCNAGNPKQYSVQSWKQLIK
jgi:hypothetical protein